MMRDIPNEFGKTSVTFFGPLKAASDLNNAKAPPGDDPTPYGSTTKFFFYCLEAMNKFLIPILKHAENVSM